MVSDIEILEIQEVRQLRGEQSRDEEFTTALQEDLGRHEQLSPSNIRVSKDIGNAFVRATLGAGL